MASKKTVTTLRDKSVDELRSRERDLREQLFKLRFQRATGRVENPMKMRQVRREIAQIQTLLNERERSAASA
ncbi:MAG TPA: 50S ribosomal protein L29 [Thermoanaerobaculia bacterium]|jgi:large subunit ribosomal protein L29|nr:50S ribosomal protein L29 [Thermoanaerobaculia bacterium]